MVDTERAALPQSICRDRLASRHRGFLAFTRAALPTVTPVDLRTHDGQLLVAVHAAADPDALVGQIVALTVGKGAFRYRRGWTVTARGQLGAVRADGFLPLEIAELDGATLVRALQRRPMQRSRT